MPEALGGDSGNRRRLQVEQDGTADRGAGRASPGSTGGSVAAGDIAIAVRDEADEARDRIKHVAAVRESDELLLDGSPVVLRPGLYEMAPRCE